MKTDREKDSADPDRNGLEAGVADNNQECGELIKRTGNMNDFAIFNFRFYRILFAKPDILSRCYTVLFPETAVEITGICKAAQIGNL